MNRIKKVCVITGTRAEYGLLLPLMKGIENSEELELQIIATGAHLVEEFGFTYRQIEADGFKNIVKVDINLESDTPLGISSSMGIAMSGMGKAYEELRPDIVVVLGDRYEIFSAAAAAVVARIPIAHIHGGETTEGAIDEAFRHSITKMSYLHFTAAEEYKKRVIQLGEDPERVYNVGGLGVDCIKRLELLSKEDLEKAINFKITPKTLMVTFHPVTYECATAEQQLSQLLQAVDSLDKTRIIFTKANADADGRIINRMIEKYVSDNPEKSIVYDSMGQLCYLSALQFVDAVVGNSSSGLLEAPSFKIPTINIGDRQKGRIKAESVIDCEPLKEDITEALTKAFSDKFQKSVLMVRNPYGDGGATERIIKVLEKFRVDCIAKKFHDIR